VGHSSQPVLCAYPLSSLPQGAAPSEDEEESLLTIEIEDGDFDEGDVSVAFPLLCPAAPAERTCQCTKRSELHTSAVPSHGLRLPHALPVYRASVCASPRFSKRFLNCAPLFPVRSLSRPVRVQVTYDLMGLETNSPLLRVGQKMYEGRSQSPPHSRTAAKRFLRP
jgi:hypothetical protein